MPQNPVAVTVSDSLATVSINHPPVNALSVGVRQGLLDALNRTEADPRIKAVLLICQGRTFMAGADIREFGKPPEQPHLPDLILDIEAASKPWIAAIHGTALGGGLEVALACRYRIASASAELGLPEVLLGLIPGAGGTVRLPRLIGPEAALELILSGKPVSASRAMDIGLLDAISTSDLLQDSIEFTACVISQSKRQALSMIAVPAVTNEEDWNNRLTTLKSKSGAQEAPQAVIKAIENTIALPWQAALNKERELFISLRDGPQSAALRYLFMAERSATRMQELKEVVPASLDEVGVIGGGTMGAGICAACLLAGLQVTLIERDSDTLQAGQQRVSTILQNSQQRNLITQQDHTAMLAAFTGSTNYAALHSADLIIEAVFEDMDVKRSVFLLLDKHSKPEAILASNTSYLDVNQIAQSINNPARLIGLHFFSPAHIMKLLELVVTDQADPVTLATGFALARRLRKVCVPAGVCDGFIGNRIMSAYRRSCDEMLEDGAMPNDIDEAMRQFGFPMGIYQMQDLAGLDIAWAMRKRQALTRNPTERYVNIADRLCELGRLGRKSGRGWYVYEGKKDILDEEVQSIIVSESAKKNIERRDFNAQQIIHRILTAMQTEGKAVLNEGIAQSAEAIDVVMVNGYGFPRWRGGPMFMCPMFIGEEK